MSNDTHQPDILNVDAIAPHSFGMRLRSTREARGLAYQDVAAQLRLSEKMVYMIENEVYPDDIPITFVRGYIRAYAKFLEIPEKEVKKALPPLVTSAIIEKEIPLKTAPNNTQHYSMKLITSLIIITLISLVGIWWYNHNKEPQLNPIAEHILSLRGESPIHPDQIAENTNSPNGALIPTEISSTDTANKAPKHAHLTLPKASALIFGHHRLMQFFTHFLLFIMIGMAAYWWYHYRMIKKLLGGKSNTAPEQFNLSPQAGNHTKTLDSHLLADFEFTIDENSTINKIRIFSSLIIFSIASLFSIWWISYLLLFTPAYLNPTQKTEDNFTFSAEEPFLDPTRPSIPITINNTENVEALAKSNGRINANEMKEFAPTSIEKYTPTPIKSLLSSKINTTTGTKKRSE